MLKRKGDRHMVATWGKQQHKQLTRNHLSHSSFGSCRVWFQKRLRPKCIKMQPSHLWQENPDSKVREGKAALQPDRGQQQEKAQQSAEEREPQHSDAPRRRSEKPSSRRFTSRSSHPGTCEMWGRGTPRHRWGLLGGRRQTADTAKGTGTGGACGARCAREHRYLLGEQPEPGAAHWRERQHFQGIIKPAAGDEACQRVQGPRSLLTWTGS